EFGLTRITYLLACKQGAQQPGKRQQKRAQQPLSLPGRMQDLRERAGGFQGGFRVAKLTRAMPANRAASMTRTTDSCEDNASALMIRTTSSLPPAAARRAPDSACAVLPGSNWPSRA